MSKRFCELEIALLPVDQDKYRLELVLSQPDSDTKAQLLGPNPASVAFNLEELAGLADKPAAYGIRLSSQLFASPRAAIAFARAREAARSQNLPLRLRLRIASGADALHGLAWETLCDPEDDYPIALKEGVYLSRELALLDSRPIYLTSRQDLRALMMVANPANFERLGLPAVDVSAEIERAASELAGVQVTALDGAAPASLNRLLDALRAAGMDGSGFDILYLVSHGGYAKGKYVLILEDDQHLYKMEDGETILQSFKGLLHPPRLVVLLACQGAKIRPVSADLAFAARLAEAGIPAVLAVQGDFTMVSSAVFMPAFFRELARDGQVDRAMAVARGTIRDRLDFWMPVLFTSLESGMIWREDPGQAGVTKYQVTVKDAKGTVIGDHNTITQQFQ